MHESAELAERTGELLTEHVKAINENDLSDRSCVGAVKSSTINFS